MQPPLALRAQTLYTEPEAPRPSHLPWITSPLLSSASQQAPTPLPPEVSLPGQAPLSHPGSLHVPLPGGPAAVLPPLSFPLPP